MYFIGKYLRVYDDVRGPCFRDKHTHRLSSVVKIEAPQSLNIDLRYSPEQGHVQGT